MAIHNVRAIATGAMTGDCVDRGDIYMIAHTKGNATFSLINVGMERLRRRVNEPGR